MRFFARFMSVAALMLAFGCGGGDGDSEPAVDCRNDDRGCNAPFTCARNEDGNYECLEPSPQNGDSGAGGNEAGFAGESGGAGDGGTEGGVAGAGGNEAGAGGNEAGSAGQSGDSGNEAGSAGEAGAAGSGGMANGCEGQDDGVIISEGEFGACEGFDSVCDLEGTQSRVSQVCEGGAIVERTVSELCTRMLPEPIAGPDRVTTCVTVAGGTLTLGDATVVIPENALSESTVVNFENIGAANVAGYQAYSEQYQLTPAAVILNAPITVSLPFTGEASNAVLFWGADNASVQRSTGSVDAGLLSAEVTRFGTGFVGNGVEFSPEVDRECVRMRTLEGRVQDPGIVGMFFTVDDCNGNPITNLTDTDFEVFEDGNRLVGAEAPRAVLNRDGLGVFVTLLLDLSASTNEHIEQVKAAASAFVTELQVTRNLPVHISIELFAGGESSTVWQPHFLDADTLLAQIATIEQYEAPSPLRSNINGAVVDAIANTESATTAFRERNRGGAFTAEYVLVFTDGYDNASLVDSQVAIDAAAASTVEVIGVGLNTESYRPAELEALSEGTVLVAQTSDELAREFQTLAARIDAQTERVYALVYCTPSGAGEHTVQVRLADSQDQQPAEFSFVADGLTGCQSADDIVGLCDSKECGGLGCGACDDRSDGCSESNICVSFCETDAPAVDAILDQRCSQPNLMGYSQYCEGPSSTLCNSQCTDLTSDSSNCGECGNSCVANAICIDAGCLLAQCDIDNRQAGSGCFCHEAMDQTTCLECLNEGWGPNCNEYSHDDFSQSSNTQLFNLAFVGSDAVVFANCDYLQQHSSASQMATCDYSSKKLDRLADDLATGSNVMFENVLAESNGHLDVVVFTARWVEFVPNFIEDLNAVEEMVVRLERLHMLEPKFFLLIPPIPETAQNFSSHSDSILDIILSTVALKRASDAYWSELDGVVNVGLAWHQLARSNYELYSGLWLNGEISDLGRDFISAQILMSIYGLTQADFRGTALEPLVSEGDF